MRKGAVSNTYEGEYYNDVKQGEGIFRWASGNVYVGSYKNDERDGQGEMTWTDGSKYIGEWRNGIQNGYGKMLFPNGTVKEGYFDNNIFKGKTKPSEEKVVDKEVPLNNRIETIEQESLWERYGQPRQSRKSNKDIALATRSGNGWYNDKNSLPDINSSAAAYDNAGYTDIMNTTDPKLYSKRKQNTVSHTQISFNRGRPQYTSTSLRQKFGSTKRPRLSTAATSSLVQKRRNLGTTSTDVRRQKPNIPKYKPKK